MKKTEHTPTTKETTMKTEHTRLRAAFALAILEDEGWIQGRAHERDNEEGAHCLWGALSFLEATGSLSDPSSRINTAHGLGEVITGARNLSVWNDAEGRTLADIQIAIINYVEKP